ncbi:hypothetical protein BS47DRAFT_1394383 [Hydnum rufescens UP504]|uniref:Uncharacterized protein n=1 Tax=Hydnum rufescens UP504 TaxID=1448309 RepID=A0A9P6AWT6_9AGAM|nr:hypothetical protein BS47DRAFT_1394383 [Hydnum rufescens UP504]
MTPSPATFPSPAANAVAVDTWYVIKASRVDLGHCTSAYWVDRLEDINAFGVQAWKKAKCAGDPGNLSLLFKSVQARDTALRQFRAKAPPGCNRQYFEGLTLMDPEATSAAHVSNLDLGLLKGYSCPPLLRFRMVSPRTCYTLQTMSKMQGAIHLILSSNLHYHRLLTLMRAQVYARGKKDIRVNIWPTDGPYDEILHILARLAHDVYGSSVTQPLLDETFGYVSHLWAIKMELALDRPRFKKHPNDVYDQEKF